MGQKYAQNFTWDDYHAVNQVYSSYKCRAKRKRIDFELSKLELYNICRKNCYLCGAEPSNYAMYSGWVNDFSLCTDFEYNGIDRVDPKLGYTIQNSQPCCKKCNYIKRNLNLKDFIEQLNKIISFNNERGK